MLGLKSAVLIAFLGVAPAISQAQQADPFAPLVAQTLRSNGMLEAATHAEERAAAQVREARALLLPRLNLESRVSEQSGTLNLGDIVNPAFGALNQLTGSNRFPTNLDISLPRSHDSYFRFSVPIVNPAIWANRSAANHRYDAQRFERLSVARDLAARVQSAWLTARSAERAVGIREATLVLVQESQRVTTRLIDAGSATPDGLFRARAEVSEAEQQLIEARDAASAALRSVNQLAGRPLDTALDDIPDSLLVRDIPIAREAALSLGVDRREELAQLEAAGAAAGSAVRAARGSFFPTIGVAVDYGFTGNTVSFSGKDDYVVASLVLSWNLFNGGGDVARISGARATQEELAARHRDLLENVRLQVLQAYDAAVAGRSAIQAADDQLESARRAYNLIGRRYQEGQVPQIELIDARSALTRAELNRSVTLYRYAQRLVELERAAALRDL